MLKKEKLEAKKKQLEQELQRIKKVERDLLTAERKKKKEAERKKQIKIKLLLGELCLARPEVISHFMKVGIYQELAKDQQDLLSEEMHKALAEYPIEPKLKPAPAPTQNNEPSDAAE